MALGLGDRLKILVGGKDALDSALYRLHPELAGRTHLTVIRSDDAVPAQTGPLAFGEAANYYQTQVWVHRAVRIVADNLASLPVRVVDEDSEPVEGHELTGLLASVNDTLAAADLWRQWATDMLLGGEEGWELVRTGRGRYAEIWPRRPHRVTVIAAKGAADYYRVAVYKVRGEADRERKFPPEEFLFFKFYNPSNPWRGMSPIGAVASGISLDIFSQAWAHRFFQQGARPDYAVITPQGITPSEKERLEFDFESRYAGIDKAHRPFILEEGVTDVKVLGWPPKDLQWEGLRQMSRDEIGAVFGVPDEIMGFGRNTYENFAEAHRVLWALTLQPLAWFRDSVLTEYFTGVGLLKEGERTESDFSRVQALKTDRTQDILNAKTLFDMAYPPNVINKHMRLGLPDITGGNTGYISMGLVPATSYAEPGQRAVPPAAIAAKQVISKPGAFPSYGSPEHAAVWKAKQDRVAPIAARMRAQLARDFQRQQVEVGRALRQQRALGRGAWKGWRALPGPDREEAGEAIKAAAAAVFDLRLEIERFKDTYEQYFALMLDSAGQAELRAVISGVDFDMESPDVQRRLADHLGAFAVKTNNTTWNDLTEMFQEAEREGESIPQIMERLSAYYGARKSDYQLDRIARTTLGGAQNGAALEAYRQSEVVEGSQWLSALKSVSRPEHVAAHGQFRPLGQAFDIGGEALEYPGDPCGSAGNVINCLCALMAVIKGVGPDETVRPPETEPPISEARPGGRARLSDSEERVRTLEERWREASLSDRARIMAGQFEGQETGLSAEEREDLEWYKCAGYRRINPILRGTTLTDDDIFELEKLFGDMATAHEEIRLSIARLDAVIDRNALQEDVITWRGTDLGHYVGDLPTEEWNRLVGTRFADQGYASTTLDHDIATKFSGWAIEEAGGRPGVLELRVPQGTNACWLEGILDTGEAELLLARGQQFEIIGIDTSGKYPIVIAEVLPGQTIASEGIGGEA